jgi:hypothetical protein
MRPCAAQNRLPLAREVSDKLQVHRPGLEAFKRAPCRQGLLQRFLVMQECIVSNTACNGFSEAGESPAAEA